MKSADSTGKVAIYGFSGSIFMANSQKVWDWPRFLQCPIKIFEKNIWQLCPFLG